MQDQLIIWMALASGTSRMRCADPSLHTRTAMVVAEQLLPGVKFRLHRPAGQHVGDQGSSGAQCQGVAATESVSPPDVPVDVWLGDGGSGGGSGLWLIECTGCGWESPRTRVLT